MDKKRKQSASYDHARTKSKKSNTGTENTLCTSSTYSTDNQRASMSAIDLNLANMQEQVNSMPSSWFDNNAVVIDLTLTSSSDSNESTVISSGNKQDTGNNYNNNCTQGDEEIVNAGMHNEEIDDSSSTLPTCSYQDYGMDCNICVNLNKVYSRTTKYNTAATERTSSLQCRDDEKKHVEHGISRRSTVIASVREEENGSFVYCTEYDEAMNEISSVVYTLN